MAGHAGLEAVGGAQDELAGADGLLVLEAELGGMGPHLQGVAEGLAPVARVGELAHGVLADGAEVQVVLRTDGKTVPERRRSGGEELVQTSVPIGAVGAVAGIADTLVAGRDLVRVGHGETRVAEGLDAHHERGVAPHREGNHEVIDVEEGLLSLQIAFAEHGELAGKAEIRHEGQGVAGGDRGRVHRVHEPLVARGDAHAAHGGVESGSGGMEVSDAIYGIGRKAVVRAVLRRERPRSRQEGGDGDPDPTDHSS